MPQQIAKELGLDTLPTVDSEVMSVNLGDDGEETIFFYRDPMQLMTDLTEKHGVDAVTGMAGLIGWSRDHQRPSAASMFAHHEDYRRDVCVRVQ